MRVNQNKALVESMLGDLSGKEKPRVLLDKYIGANDEELKQQIAFFEAAFPCYEHIADDIISEGNKVAVRSTFKGTHQGDLMGIPPTGKEVILPITIIYRIDGGKIVEHWMEVDQLNLMQQLGVVPSAV